MSEESGPGARVRRVVLRAAGAAAGLALAGTAVQVARQNRVIHRRDAGERVPLGSLRAPARTVVADDGLALHVEVDEPESAVGGPQGERPGRVARLAGRSAPPALTVVFVHGYALSLDCWHFQRAAYRGLVRTVFYDQRSHGRSGRSDREHATIDQLGLDLLAVLDSVAPEGPVVLVGHSMGGMTIVALAEQHPELFGDRIVGTALISTTAGGLDPGRILLPMVPARLGGRAVAGTVGVLSHGHRSVDRLRRVGRAVATVATDAFAFGGEVPAEQVRFVDAMLSATPFEVVAQFFPSFRSLDKFHAVEVLGRVPTSIVCGTADRLTGIGHSRKLHSRIAGSRLLECEGAGHMVIMERHGQVDAELDQLLAAAAERVARR
ncbi:alpha/beta hydrolase [Nocardioides sp. TRM66260-LWL]|uniref:alpha/beta fold hydrolase n=1 Tax=Nocardioides sp. TRM66260-LWL TaxID=2874478 RepID=UPI001CC40106|nr:alpha/beta hydrolase [Nocardioides sp. TRM66260-LWL]MBZ5736081.1 alpha/beta hydrolase [Nocardioides sp. TRM66260-LWL]